MFWEAIYNHPNVILHLDHVCFLKSSFWKIIFQTFLCLFTIRKVSQQKHFPVNGNTFRSTENLVWFPGKCFLFWLCLFSGKWFPRNHFPNFHVFICHYKSWSTENTFQSKENLAWFSGKCFPRKFGRKTLFGGCEKFRNVIICWLYQIWFSNFWLLYIICLEYLFFNFIS